MRRPVLSLFSTWRWSWALTLLAALVPSSFGQSPAGDTSRPSAGSVEAPTAISQEGPTGAISSLLEKGRLLEAAGNWAETLNYYEDALRAHPHDRALESRFDLARLHFSLEQRQADRSFRASVQTLRPRQARDLYVDLLDKIEAHYFTTPVWQEMILRGTHALDIALSDEEFLTRHNIRASAATIEQLRADIAELSNRYVVGTREDAVGVAAQTAWLANQRIGLNETATWFEFCAAAAGGLDHYSAYLTSDQLRDIYSQIEGNFVGLGVELRASGGALLIVNVISLSPAEKAGLRPGDRIVAVDGQETRELSTEAAAALLTGPEGSLVRVTTVSPGESPRDITIRRSEVELPSLEGVRIVEPETGVAYLRIPAFQKTTAGDLEAALWDLHRQGMRSLIVDVRGNPGGLLTASVEVADLFVANGPIVSTRGRSEQENFNYRAHRPGTWRVPLVVLIDGDSASASEIFAGAIKDSGRGTVVGARSYGKGSVQGIFPLGTSGSGARITTAKFFSPNGNPISRVGITPDIDARRATAVANGPEASAFQAGFRGPDASLAPQDGESGAEPHDVASARAAAAASPDPALEIAVEVARTQPIAQL